LQAVRSIEGRLRRANRKTGAIFSAPLGAAAASIFRFQVEKIWRACQM
jgi:hypothetical protein